MPNGVIDEARRTSFDAAAEVYDAVRPSYPDALVDAVLARGRRVLEIGPGTGKATVPFARRGASIVAIEPGPGMAAVLRRNTAGLDVAVEITTFEAWPIAGAFDVVMAAQAIHWIDPRVRYAKPAAILAPGGTLAVIRNETVAFERSLRDEVEAAYARWPVGERDPSADPVESARRHIADEIDASGLYGAVELAIHPWTATYTTAQYLDLLRTYSDHAVLAPADRAGLFGAIGAAIDRRGGALEVRYLSLAFLARRT